MSVSRSIAKTSTMTVANEATAIIRSSGKRGALRREGEG
jgi:hypothetical protein